MDVLPIDLNAIAGILIGGLVVIIPVLGFTVRFALKPVVEAIARTREGQTTAEQLALLEQRIGLIEQRLEGIGGNVERLLEEREFGRRLAAGSQS